MPMTYLSVAEARDLPGLRLVLSSRVPGPWGEAAKALFKIRGVPFTPVEQLLMKPNEELVAWTGVRNAPIAVYDDEPPRSTWHDILMLAERLGSGPSLLPDEPLDRALAQGLCAEIAGPEGLGWTRRVELMGRSDGGHTDDPIRRGYGVRPETVQKALSRMAFILRGLSEQHRRQRERGLDYLVGSRLSAADVYWTCFSQMVRPFTQAQCPLPGGRSLYENLAEEAARELDSGLIELRDRVLEEHIGTPLEF